MVLNHWKSEGLDVVVSYLPVWELCFSMHVLSNPDHHIYREKWAKRTEWQNAEGLGEDREGLRPPVGD